MLILGIESSCDETGAAVVRDGRFIRSNVVASQAEVHARYGGVVPEVASRQQLAAIIPVLEMALEQAEVQWSDLDAIAATYGPGLAGSLLVGLTAAKTLAWARRLPFIGVNHLEAHIYANWLRDAGDASAQVATADSAESACEVEVPGDPRFPILALVVSGAHTELVHIPRHGRYELLGQTRDDAAGEAFDKVSRLLGLGYPGGPAIQQAAESRDAQHPNPYQLPRAWLRGTYGFSFSGLKTAVLHLVESVRKARQAEGVEHLGADVADIAAAFQDAVVDVLVGKTVEAAREWHVAQVMLAGGVAANTQLRARLADRLRVEGIPLRYPPVALCTDNAAMIAGAAYYHLRLGERHGFELDVEPGLQLPFAPVGQPGEGLPTDPGAPVETPS